MITNESSRMTNSHQGGSNRIKQKIIFLGDQFVGKTCIIERYMNDTFAD
jgi:GTPase SAR1 family protein